MKRSTNNNVKWQEVHWARPFQHCDVLELLAHLAVFSPRKQIIWEARGSNGKVRYFIGTHRRYINPLKTMFQAHGKIIFSDVSEKERGKVDFAKNLKRSKAVLSLNTKNSLAVLKTALAALADTKKGETLVVQIILGESFAPLPAPDQAVNPHASLLSAICGKTGAASKESLSSIKDKSSQHGFYSVIRIGAGAATKYRLNNLLHSLTSALRQFEAVGVKLSFPVIDSELLNKAKMPWFLSLRLSIAELAGFTLLPSTNTELAGVDGLHPKLLHPSVWLHDSNQRIFAKSLGATPVKLGIPIKDSLEHTVILGPTGAGKSTVMQNLIMSDIQAERSVLVIDPKADLVNDILSQIPKERADDVVVVDPSSNCPVGLNPFNFNTKASPALISDTILAIFKQVFKDSWGVYSQDVLSAALLTLAQTKGSTLLHLPRLLTDEAFRRSITSKICDKQGLEPFWTDFEAKSKTRKQQVISPVMNKLRQFTVRPTLRNMLGQSQPKFNLSDLFTKNKIVLVPLNKGIIGAESAKLIGSLIVGLTWTLALSRANLPADSRKPVSIYIDELQDYISSISTDFSDALAQARGLGVVFTVAHQYRSQLAPDIKAAIDTNARNKIIFGLNVADAKDMAAMAPELETADFMFLPRHHVYVNLQNNGQSTGWISGKTLPIPKTDKAPMELKIASMKRYGQAPTVPQPAITPREAIASTPIGRKKIK